MGHGVVKDGVYFKKEKEKDQLRMAGGSWSINLADVDFDKAHTIVFCTDTAHYIISATDAQFHGFERTLGGEEKLVVPLKYWEVRPNDTPRKA